MKKILLTILVATVAVAAVAVPTLKGRVQYGFGKTATVTTTPQQISVTQTATATSSTNTLWFVREMSVNNSGSTVVYALMNCSTGYLASAIAATNAIPIPASTTYTFTAFDHTTQITNICVQSASSSNVVYFAGH